VVIPRVEQMLYKKSISTLYEDMSRSTASAPEIRRFLVVVKYCVLSLTPPSGEQSCSKISILKLVLWKWSTKKVATVLKYPYHEDYYFSLWRQIETRIKICELRRIKDTNHNFHSIWKPLQISLSFWLHDSFTALQAILRAIDNETF